MRQILHKSGLHRTCALFNVSSVTQSQSTTILTTHILIHSKRPHKWFANSHALLDSISYHQAHFTKVDCHFLLFFVALFYCHNFMPSSSSLSKCISLLILKDDKRNRILSGTVISSCNNNLSILPLCILSGHFTNM